MTLPSLQSSSHTPCVRNCCLDENDICMGCYRHIDEILAWNNASDSEKQQILCQCSARRERASEHHQFPG